MTTAVIGDAAVDRYQRGVLRPAAPTVEVGGGGPAPREKLLEGCPSCGSPVVRQAGRGRPRTFCTGCRPPADVAAANRAWRKWARAHDRAVRRADAHAAAHPLIACAVCETQFEAACGHHLYCSWQCKRTAQRQHWRERRAAA
jgi:hypothetical protein